MVRSFRAAAVYRSLCLNNDGAKLGELGNPKLLPQTNRQFFAAKRPTFGKTLPAEPAKL
jgi:hypothetical protein